jgi:hypothetical protein
MCIYNGYSENLDGTLEDDSSIYIEQWVQVLHTVARGLR